MYKEVFSLRLMAKRKELDLSQTQVSNDTEINQANISKYETGKLEPNLETLGKLAEYYQVSVDWLLGNQHNGKKGSIMKAALKELVEEMHETVNGAFYQKMNIEETEVAIHEQIDKDYEAILAKYAKEEEAD